MAGFFRQQVPTHPPTARIRVEVLLIQIKRRRILIPPGSLSYYVNWIYG
jgi:hypothetical protein